MKQILATLAVAVSLVTVSPAAAHEVAGTTLCPNRGALMRCLINHIRSHNAAPKLAGSAILTDGAKKKREQLLTCGWNGTHDPCGTGPFFTYSLYPARALGENLAYGYGLQRATFRAWLASPGHRANILNPTFREFGSSWCRDCRYPFLWVNAFGAR